MLLQEIPIDSSHQRARNNTGKELYWIVSNFFIALDQTGLSKQTFDRLSQHLEVKV